MAGSVHEFGPVSLDETEIIDFGKRFVPQPYHTDAELAKKTRFTRVSSPAAGTPPRP